MVTQILRNIQPKTPASIPNSQPDYRYKTSPTHLAYVGTPNLHKTQTKIHDRVPLIEWSEETEIKRRLGSERWQRGERYLNWYYVAVRTSRRWRGPWFNRYDGHLWLAPRFAGNRPSPKLSLDDFQPLLGPSHRIKYLKQIDFDSPKVLADVESYVAWAVFIIATVVLPGNSQTQASR